MDSIRVNPFFYATKIVGFDAGYDQEILRKQKTATMRLYFRIII